MPDMNRPDNLACSKGLARNLDVASGLEFNGPQPNDPCRVSSNAQPLLDVVDNEVFPMEAPAEFRRRA